MFRYAGLETELDRYCDSLYVEALLEKKRRGGGTGGLINKKVMSLRSQLPGRLTISTDLIAGGNRTSELLREYALVHSDFGPLQTESSPPDAAAIPASNEFLFPPYLSQLPDREPLQPQLQVIMYVVSVPVWTSQSNFMQSYFPSSFLKRRY